MKLLKCLLQIMCLTLGTNTYATNVLSYVLVPGSTITPLFEGSPIGPTQPLIGSFDWIQVDTASSLIGFDATRLEFQAGSFRIELNTTVNDLGTSVFPDSCLTYFGEIVDLTGLGVPIGNMASYTDGCYSGLPDRPNFINYPDVRIAPFGGGFFVARLSLIAALDTDHDGVPDDSDQCPNTAAGAFVDAQGCSIDQLVPCAGPATGGTWKNRGEYVSTIAKTAQAFRLDGVITKDEEEAVIKAAAQSECAQNR